MDNPPTPESGQVAKRIARSGIHREVSPGGERVRGSRCGCVGQSQRMSSAAPRILSVCSRSSQPRRAIDSQPARPSVRGPLLQASRWFAAVSRPLGLGVKRIEASVEALIRRGPSHHHGAGSSPGETALDRPSATATAWRGRLRPASSQFKLGDISDSLIRIRKTAGCGRRLSSNSAADVALIAISE